jgi:hypothetical protein
MANKKNKKANLVETFNKPKLKNAIIYSWWCYNVNVNKK